MKYTDNRSASTIVRCIDIEDGPIHKQAYSTAGRLFRADRIAIKYYLADTGTWEVQSSYEISITGTVLKKDGSDSQNGHTRRPESVNRYGEPSRFEGEWAWVGELIDRARPEGLVVLPSLEAVRDL
jgi:hypothetical protein